MSTPGARPSSSATAQRAATILLVNDNPTQLDAMSLLLRQEGYTLYTAADGAAALEILQRVSPDLVISDVVMPGVDGIELCRRMRSSPAGSEIPILLVTGLRYDDSGVVEGFEAGADDYLEIDGPVGMLLKKIERLIAQRQQQIWRREAEERLTRSEMHARLLAERFRTIFDNIPLMVAFIDAGGRLEMANSQWERIIGWTAEEARERDILADLFPDPATYQKAAKAVRRATGQWKDVKVRVRDGSFKETAWANVRLSNGSIICIGQDASERIRLEEQLRQAQKMEAIGRLAGGVAHDFNNLLTAILGYSQYLLQNASLQVSAREAVEEIHRAGERAAALTDQLLAFSRKKVVQTRTLNLNETVHNLERMLRRLIGEDIDLETFLAPDLGLVKADPGQMEQIVLNLAINARDAMPTGGKLTIETRNVDVDAKYVQQHFDVALGAYVVLSMSDTGVGIPADALPHIFEPFFTTKDQGKGTGLGLAMVYGIVKQTGGHIMAYSEPGHGSTFKIYLPRVDVRDEPERYAAPEAAAGGTETILLVEDEAIVRNLLRQLLEGRGYVVLEAANGAQALEAVRQHEGAIDLIVTDVVMPDLNGRELADRISGTYPHIKVLFMSGYTDDAVVRHGVLSARMHFIQKPFSSGALAQKIRDVLDEDQTS